ncbi:hypothetical protein TRFO_01321 [Tritrichomonas foetus]|uniref:Uncharacterized protein n=1 Tax=Tritrichomonas foetus TaxID=1144522 RepID=A0A1J4K6U1_9EUKA|nr:hypothetical protein TRFO_01321 [Tritrichomonas foetus]|eukprot:OHT07185.1 hypothetical protein TRFO_01321 [Tritrichomonas foetus]
MNHSLNSNDNKENVTEKKDTNINPKSDNEEIISKMYQIVFVSKNPNQCIKQIKDTYENIFDDENMTVIDTKNKTQIKFVLYHEKLCPQVHKSIIVFCFSFDDESSIPFALSFYKNKYQLFSRSLRIVVGFSSECKSITMCTERGKYLLNALKANAYVECSTKNKINVLQVMDAIKYVALHPKGPVKVYLDYNDNDLLGDPVFCEFAMVFGPSIRQSLPKASEQIVIEALFRMFKETPPLLRMAMSQKVGRSTI